jgi:hypothetical protein
MKSSRAELGELNRANADACMFLDDEEYYVLPRVSQPRHIDRFHKLVGQDVSRDCLRVGD